MHSDLEPFCALARIEKGDVAVGFGINLNL
jgi:hypothetical protein